MKTVIEMAREAGLEGMTGHPALHRFAALVRADEREKVIKEFVDAGVVGKDGAVVEAIRARGNT